MVEFGRPPVTITGATPTYRHGLTSALAAEGWSVETPSDLGAWCCGESTRMLVAHLRTTADEELLIRLPESKTLIPVALVDDAVAEDHVRLIRKGATVVVNAEAEPGHIVACLDAVLSGGAMMPLVAVHRLVAIARSSADRPALAPEEVTWLQLLADGCSVTDLAANTYVSARAMHRALGGLYERIGASNRDQAVTWAARCGLID